MIFYIYFLIIIFFAIYYKKFQKVQHLEKVIFGFLFLIIGFRYRTGGDFRPYIKTFDLTLELDYTSFNFFEFLNFFSRAIGLDIFGINLILSLIFTLVLYLFLKKYFNNIYLGLVISFPIYVTIYSIGSLRQGMAITFFLVSLLFSSYYKKFLSLGIAILFHFSSVIYFFFHIPYLFKLKNSLAKYLIPSSFLLIIIFSLPLMQSYYQYYIIDDQYHSKGFIFRNIATFICAFIFIYWYFKKKRIINKDLLDPFLAISIASIAIFPFGFYFSTVADRIMGYFLPLQIYVIYLLYETCLKKNKFKIINLICIYSFLSFFVWQSFGQNPKAWTYELFFFPNKFWSFN